jgi:aryl-phospho-beta-D-glucosidase BglC (GH1 family)
LEKAVKQARDAGLKVIPVAFEVPFELKGRNRWDCPELEAAYTHYWVEIVKRLQPYKDAIWGYDLVNEPLERSQLPYAPLQWRTLAVKLVRAIRKVDPDAWIVYEAGPGGDWRGFEDLKPLPDDKIIYSLHFYEPGAFTHQGIAATQLQDPNLIARAQKQIGIRYPGVVSGVYWNRARFEEVLKPVIDFQKKYNVPIYVGEFSVIAWAPPECAAQYLKDVTDIFDKYGWSWTYHGYREYYGWRLDVEEGVFRPSGVLKYKAETKRGAVIKSAFKRHAE